MKDNFLIQVNAGLAREMFDLRDTQPEAVALMELILSELDEDNHASLSQSNLAEMLALPPDTVLTLARGLMAWGWLDSVVFDCDVLFALVNKEYARVLPESD